VEDPRGIGDLGCRPPFVLKPETDSIDGAGLVSESKAGISGCKGGCKDGSYRLCSGRKAKMEIKDVVGQLGVLGYNSGYENGYNDRFPPEHDSCDRTGD